MERYLDKDGKWAWRYEEEIIIRKNEEPVKNKVVKKKK